MLRFLRNPKVDCLLYTVNTTTEKQKLVSVPRGWIRDLMTAEECLLGTLIA